MSRRFVPAGSLAAFRGFALVSLLSLVSACAGTQKSPAWPAEAKKWFDRAELAYATGDLDDARLGSDNALKALPGEAKVKIIVAKVAMAELEFDRALQVLREVPGTDAARIRGRAHWYLGNLEETAAELEAVAADPEVKDTWAKEILHLARSGRGRRPFEMTGGLVSVVEMPRAGNTSMLVPIEVDGEPALAMVATDRAEAVIDTRGGKKEGDWVSLRFGGRLEVSDVPAVGADLSGLEREIGAPIKMLIGVHLLRKLRATIDLAGRQFVVRNYEPPPPPAATTLNPIFYRGGAMVLPVAFSEERTAPVSTLMMNTSLALPLALDEEGWKKGGEDSSKFVAMPGGGKMRHGVLPLLRLGSFEIPKVPGVIGAPIAGLEEEMGIDLDGIAGSALFSIYRLTFADRGRTLWLEGLPQEVLDLQEQIARELHAQRVKRQKGAPTAPGAMPLPPPVAAPQGPAATSPAPSGGAPLPGAK